MNCEQFEDLYELYALGVLDGPEKFALEQHLLTDCATCRSRIGLALDQIGFVSASVPLTDPPANLRHRVLNTFAPAKTPRSQSFIPWAIAAALLVSLGTGIVAEDRARRTDAALAQSLNQDLARMQDVLDILKASGTREVAFQNATPQGPHGSVLINAQLGVALVVGNLPVPGPGLKYETWYVPKSGAPRPVKPFFPNEAGVAVVLMQSPADASDLKAVAVSLEPADSNPVKPTTLVFAAPV